MSRNLPFGFEMINGKVVLNQEESDIVKLIFSDTENGLTKEQICDKLKDEIKPHFAEKWSFWNVRNILNNSEKYIKGEVITQKTADNVAKVRLAKNLYARVGINEQTFRPLKLRKLICCYKCGGKMPTPRRCNSNHKCENCGFEMRIGESELCQLLIKTKLEIAEHKPRVQAEKYEFNETAETIRADNEVSKLLSRKIENPDYIRQMIFKAAEIKYNSINPLPKNQMVIKLSDISGIRYKRHTTELTDTDVEQFLQVVEKILVDENQLILTLK
jgi:hypothetical protein